MTDKHIEKSHWQLAALDGAAAIPILANMLAGREASCDITITAGNLSRKHAQLTLDDKLLFLQDLGSTNGTYVNNQRITEKVQLHDGDIIRFDSIAYTATFFDPDSTRANASAAAEEVAPAAIVAEAKPAVPEPAAVAPVPVSVSVSVSTPAPAPAKDSNAPPSWAMERSKSVDNTHIMSDAMMEDLKRRKMANEAAKLVSAPTLVGKAEPVLDKQFTLQAAGTDVKQWEIGRSAQCDVVIDHPSISTSHAQIVNEGNKWKLIDSMSANGTYVNGEKGLTSYLANGDMIRFGMVDFQILLPATEKNAKKKQATVQKKTSALWYVLVLAVVAAACAAAYFLKLV